MDYCTMEIILGSKNWQEYISKVCVHSLFKWDLCSDRVMTKSGMPKACYYVLKMCKLSVVSLTKKNTLDLLSPETNQNPRRLVCAPSYLYSPKKPNRQKWQQQEQQKTGYTAIYHKKLGRLTQRAIHCDISAKLKYITLKWCKVCKRLRAFSIGNLR